MILTAKIRPILYKIFRNIKERKIHIRYGMYSMILAQPKNISVDT